MRARPLPRLGLPRLGLPRLSLPRLALPVLLALLLPLPALADPSPPCPANRVPPLALPHVREAIAANREVTVVALGSSSTQGWHSSDIAHTYPSILQAQLNASLPTSHVAVINRGIGGQDVAEMLPRLESDALALRPTLVIWQVGANGAMKMIAPELFKRLVTTGVRRLHEAKVDVILMDNQRAPAILASREHLQIDQAMAEIAVATGAGLFSRGELMDQWRASGYPYERFISDDGLHHNDFGYRCLASTLTAAIVDGLAQDVPTTRTAAKR